MRNVIAKGLGIGLCFLLANILIIWLLDFESLLQFWVGP